MHHTRRILLAFSFAASAASVAFADYQNIGQTTDDDRLKNYQKHLLKVLIAILMILICLPYQMYQLNCVKKPLN
jgi:hypothetical protein